MKKLGLVVTILILSISFTGVSPLVDGVLRSSYHNHRPGGDRCLGQSCRVTDILIAPFIAQRARYAVY